MSSACPRCGFPNDENAQYCRACSAPLQDTSSEATIKPRLRQIIAETRARTRARQRRGVSVDPNRVDVVPRLPSGVAASETALKTALEKGRLARLQGLREELRKGRPEVDPPARESIPPQSSLTPQPSKPEPEQAREPAPPQASPEPSAQAPKQADVEGAAQRFLDEPVEPIKAAPTPKAPVVVKIETRVPTPVEPAVSTAIEPAAPVLIEGESELAAESKPPVALDSEPLSALNLEPSLDASAISEPNAEPDHPAETPAQAVPQAEPSQPAMALPIEEPSEIENPSIKPLLSAAAKTALSNLRQTAQRLKQKVQDEEQVVDERRCRLYDKHRLFSTFIDFAPTITLATLWLSAQFNQSRLPPEEVMASWLLGEAGGTPWGLLMVAVFWLVWCWAGIAVWNVTPGMKAARLSWSEASKWKLFARPPLFLVSLLPLGLGGTYALLDKNSRGLSDLALRLTWRKL